MSCDVVFITDSRSEYSLMKRTLKELKKYIKLKIIATGMHLSEKYGYTVKEIEKDGFDVEKVESLLDSNSLGTMVKTLGIELYGITQIVERLNPKLIFVEGDRGDALAGAIIGSYLNIPVVHHGGGDISESIDNKIRYAISMFADYHLVGNIESYNRLIRMGIPKERVFIVGEPGLDDIYLGNFTSEEEIVKKFNINKKKPLALLIYHPNTKEFKDIEVQIKSILDAIAELKLQTIAIYSNCDAGGNTINNYLEKYSSKYDFIKVFPHINRKDFLGLMNICDLMIGNSSSGIVELPSFKKPFIHVGNRQRGRLTGGNVIFVGYNKGKIKESIYRALYDINFKEKLKNIKNPYGNGTAFLKITKIILNILNKVV
ncbi:UDP-N-acetylglucosamine 2-epimerase [Methanotorris formicicus]|uniref:UDP-N-acetyl-D-glucosamine 2-epimerase, UDP-hydrolysing n=1 Tax=Methanotorris formicicus Mc-S-70 TaxID=647171 RepID=H1KWH6_9EURY|nr:UDP-N-acetylglucosamine 2-epimerase [Methanotorris formicicus]EHP89553.1 UDP-N-acetyl-D-glucosamine 2-epimerase, UDP-hydrolysing [Methanotorris formicicus Mc-S-70]